MILTKYQAEAFYCAQVQLNNVWAKCTAQFEGEVTVKTLNDGSILVLTLQPLKVEHYADQSIFAKAYGCAGRQ